MIEINDKSAQFLDALAKASRKVLNRIGKDCVEKAKSLAPVRHGKLRDSIKKNVKEINGDLVLQVGSTDFRAHFFERGTVKMGRKPFIGPATVGIPQEFEKQIEQEAKKIKL